MTTTEITATAREDARNSFDAGIDAADAINDFQSANAGIAGYETDEYRVAFLAEWAAIAAERFAIPSQVEAWVAQHCRPELDAASVAADLVDAHDWGADRHLALPARYAADGREHVASF